MRRMNVFRILSSVMVMAAIICLCAVCKPLIGNAFDSVNTKETQDLANSWRYSDGKRMYGDDLCSFSLNRTGFTPWTWNGTGYVNSQGKVIPNAIRKGIDVSEHNGNIDWTQVKSSDVDYAIIRCGYGMNEIGQDDKKWSQNIAGAENAGVPYGVYIYSYATTVEKAKSEAEHVLRLVKGKKMSYPIYFDMEDASTSGIGKVKLTEIAKMFCNTIEAAGYDVGVYANLYWWNTYLTDPVFDNWHRWVAQYHYQCDYSKSYQMWQCSSVEKIPGISGNVDLNFEIGKQWKFENISTNVNSPQAMNVDVDISAIVSNPEPNLQYKFVWMKDGWTSWGVIQAFGNLSNATWKTPSEPGDYKIYVDVKDSTGKTVTKIIDYTVKTWGVQNISTSLQSPQAKLSNIGITTNILGDSSNLQYKYVWMRDRWNSWEVYQNTSGNTSAEWIPQDVGEYTLYTDVIDSTGYQVTTTTKFTIVDKLWKYDSLQLSQNSPIEIGNEIEIQPQIEDGNESDRLEYKYVWMKDDWNQWGVLQEFSPSSTYKWNPQESGEYSIYVDVEDFRGNKETQINKINIKTGKWNLDGIMDDVDGEFDTGKPINISQSISGNVCGLRYKYVWMKDDWDSWGVLKDFSFDNSCSWTPTKPGEYYIYVDVTDGTKSSTIRKKFDVHMNWSLNSIIFDVDTPQPIGNTINIKPQVTNADSNLKYKYVWMKDDWKDWGVLNDFSLNNYCQWTPKEIGLYYIYVDVIDQYGNLYSTREAFMIRNLDWNYISIDSLKDTSQKIGSSIPITPVVTGDDVGTLSYKYVWMKDGWKEWGILQDTSKNENYIWTPTESGLYNIYVDVSDKTGKILTKIIQFNITE